MSWPLTIAITSCCGRSTRGSSAGFFAVCALVSFWACFERNGIGSCAFTDLSLVMLRIIKLKARIAKPLAARATRRLHLSVRMAAMNFDRASFVIIARFSGREFDLGGFSAVGKE